MSQQIREAGQKVVLMLARCLLSRRVISRALGQRCVFAGYNSPEIFNKLKKKRLFPGYPQRVALYLAYDISSVAAAKLRAWLEP